MNDNYFLENLDRNPFAPHDLYKDATPELMRELREAAQQCTGFAVLTDRGAKLLEWVNILDEHDPRGRAYNRLQDLHLRASGVTCEY